MTDVDNFRNPIIEKAHVLCYSIHKGFTKVYYELREVFLWDVLKNRHSVICCKMSELSTSES